MGSVYLADTTFVQHYVCPTTSNYIINKYASKIIKNSNKILCYIYYVIYKLKLNFKIIRLIIVSKIINNINII
jgi:hypothetical protein